MPGKLTRKKKQKNKKQFTFAKKGI